MQTSTSIPAEFPACPHDRGPGITVCLRCRAEGHRKAAVARRRVAAQLGVAGVVLVTLLVMGNGAYAARARMTATTPAAAPATDSAHASHEESFGVAQAGAAQPNAPAEVVATPPAPAATEGTTAIVVAEGRTALRDGMSVERSGDSVTVHFDTPVYRTRRRDKLEQVVRATLPAVYGGIADGALAQVPAGTLASGGDLLTEIPVRGIRLPASEGWTLTLWPGTRPGHDGPLVVRYRVTALRAQ